MVDCAWGGVFLQNIRDLILARTAAYGDREYLVAKDQTFSFTDLDRRSRQVAHGFSEVGVKIWS
jgi:non-ribosomal peptide synthetase component E (peptide arylation enzyme)